MTLDPRPAEDVPAMAEQVDAARADGAGRTAEDGPGDATAMAGVGVVQATPADAGGAGRAAEGGPGVAGRARMMRLFVAVFPPVEAIAHLTIALSTTDIRLPAAERLHITLAFLGDVPDAGPAIEALDTGMAEPGAKPVGELAIQGGGRFGSILWAGIVGDVAGLGKLTRRVRRNLRAHRLKPDDKRFRPHLTLARRLSGEQIAAGLRVLRGYEGPAWPVREIVLVHSVLGAQPVYHALKAWQL